MSTSAPFPSEPGPEDLRARIISAAARLIAAEGPEAATTRAVALAAGVQPPALYRLFGDKQGLLDAVAEHEMAVYVGAKAQRAPDPDPVEDLRHGWDTHVGFGLSNPGLFAILSGLSQPGEPSPAVAAGDEVLRQRVRRIAQAGRLRTGEARALAMIRSACVGTVLTLLGQPPSSRDPDLSERMREAVLGAITGEAPARTDRHAAGAAAQLHASLAGVPGLTPGERHLLAELLQRIAEAG